MYKSSAESIPNIAYITNRLLCWILRVPTVLRGFPVLGESLFGGTVSSYVNTKS